MKQIIVAIQPFVYKQTVQICDDNNVLDMRMVPMKSVVSMVKDFCKNKEINKVVLKGSPMFTTRIKQDLLSLNKFENLNIDVVQV